MAKTEHLVYPTLPGSVHQSDARLFHRAIKERWPMSDEARARWVARMAEIIEEGDNREAVQALKVAATFDAINQRDELAAKYAIPVDQDGTTRILAPHEVAQQMLASVPEEESKMKEVIPHPDEQAGEAKQASMKSGPACSPVVPLAPFPTGTGA